MGTIDEFLEKKKHENFRSFEVNPQKPEPKKKEEKASSGKVNYQQKKELEKDIRRLKKDISNTEKKVEAKEIELEEIESKMADPDLMGDIEKSKEITFKHGQVQKELNQYLARWEKQLAELEELEKLA